MRRRVLMAIPSMLHSACFVAVVTGVYVSTKHHLRGLEERQRQMQVPAAAAAAAAKDHKT
jgi:hypothetical protein